MKKERDAQTIEAEMKKRQEILKKEHDKIRSLNAELTTAKKREKARRYNKIGSAIEDVLGVGELSDADLMVLIDCLRIPFHTKDGVETTIGMRFANAIKTQRAKVSAAGSSAPNGATSANPKPEAVPAGRQGFTGTGNGSSLPLPPPAKP
ncbi:hypothetical protein [uncultured Acidaminococcus sp.]|uniref:hypothetical protein n=1 Tax=uncultured Acidaminococcus sp. TaxID=352152 RepID=UPI002583ADF2|nr:hypothetical protein [uncultured Acidaminococcus sp.]